MCMTTITVAHITNAAMLLVTGSGKQKRYIEFDEEGMVTTSITLGLTWLETEFDEEGMAATSITLGLTWLETESNRKA